MRLNTMEDADKSAAELNSAINDPSVSVEVNKDSNGAPSLIVRKTLYGNTHVTVLDADFVYGNDYHILEKTAASFLSLIGTGAVIRRGEGDNQKQQAVKNFHEAMQWLRSEAERGISKQRYKGLGEMNPDQLWETTMDPSMRRLLKVKIEDAIAADQIFTTLMGDNVEPRRAFIENQMCIRDSHNSGAGKSSIQNMNPARKPCIAATAMVPKTVARMVVPIILNRPFVS